MPTRSLQGWIHGVPENRPTTKRPRNVRTALGENPWPIEGREDAPQSVMSGAH